MKTSKRVARLREQFSTPAGNGSGNGNGAATMFSQAQALKGKLKEAGRRYVDLTDRKRAEEAIRRSEERYRTLFDLVPVAVYTCNAGGLIQEFNQRAVELWGRKPRMNDRSEKFCGSFKIFHPDGRPMPHSKCPMARVLGGERLKTSELEILVEQPDGSRRRVIVSPTALRSDKGKIVGAINCLHDVTDRRKAEEAIRESEEFHRALVTQTGVGMVRSDLQGRFVYVNQTFCEMLGYKKSELIGKTIVEITHAEHISESRKLFRRIVNKGEPYQIEKRYVRKDGSFLWADVSASPMRSADGRTQAAIAVIVDVGERKKAEAMLERANLRLESRVEERTGKLVAANKSVKKEIALRHRLEGEILEISEREQRRLGLDLHDSLCQHLTATAFLAQAVAVRLRDHRVVEVRDLEKIAELINEGVTEARTIARGLHPVEMDPAGLANAFGSFLHQRSKLSYRLDVDEQPSTLDPKVALHLYRIATEAIINANKHARAREIIVRMRTSSKQIELSVTDDGVGLRHGKAAGGLGFHIMNYRARMIGARLEVKSVKPHGTRVTCYVPRK